MPDETTKTEDTNETTTTPRGRGERSAAPAAVAAAARAATTTQIDEHTETVAAPDFFKIERVNKQHKQTAEAKAEPPMKVEIVHGRYLCGTATRDKQLRSRLSCDVALVGDRVTVSAVEAKEMIAAGVARRVDARAAD